MQSAGRGPPRITTFVYQNDVLFGRGSPSYHNEGNIRLRALVRARGIEYAATNKHEEKTKIAAEVVQVVLQREGRFLRKIETEEEALQLGVPEDANEAYVIVDDTTIFRKVKQLLREQKKPPAKGAYAKLNEEIDPASLVVAQANKSRETHMSSIVPSSEDDRRKRRRDEEENLSLEIESLPRCRKASSKCGSKKKNNDSLENVSKLVSSDLSQSVVDLRASSLNLLPERTYWRQHESEENWNSGNEMQTLSQDGTSSTKRLLDPAKNQDEVSSSLRQSTLPAMQDHLIPQQIGQQLPVDLLQNNSSRPSTTSHEDRIQMNAMPSQFPTPSAIGQPPFLPNFIPVQHIYMPLQYVYLVPPGIQDRNPETNNQMFSSSVERQEHQNTLLPQGWNDLRTAEAQQVVSLSPIQSLVSSNAGTLPRTPGVVGSSLADINYNGNTFSGTEQLQQHHSIQPDSFSFNQN